MSSPTTSRLMGLDVGDARIGVALSDLLGIGSQPLTTIENKGKSAVAEIVALAKEHSVSGLVLGLPYELSGEIGPQAQKVMKFAETLEAALGSAGFEQPPSLHYWDERLSSVEAERMIAGSKLKNKQRSAQVDRVAAAIILDAFMRSQGPLS